MFKTKKERKGKKRKTQERKRKKKKLNEGYTDPADTLMVLFFLILLEKTIRREQLVLGRQPTLTIPGNQIRSFYFMLIL